MVRSVGSHLPEQLIYYCSESDFEYAIYLNEKCKVIVNISSKQQECYIGTLFDLDDDYFILRINDGFLVKINFSDIEDIYSEKEIGPLG